MLFFYYRSDGIIKCCDGYTWNRVQERCIGTFIFIVNIKVEVTIIP